jgi:hypothetical protein
VVVGDVHEDALRRLGFRPGEAGVGTIRELSTTPPRRVVLPPGYTVRDILHTGGRRVRLACMAQAFLGEDGVPKDATYPRADLPGYRPGLDLAVIAPHGIDVATCFGFVPGAGLDRLAERGVSHATATGWNPEANAVYRGLLPTRSRRIDAWVLVPA